MQAENVARCAERDAVKREMSPVLSRESEDPDAPEWPGYVPTSREEEVDALRMRLEESERRQHEEMMDARQREQRLEHELRVALTSTRPPSPLSPPSPHSDTAREENRTPSYMFKPLLAAEIAPIRLSMDEAVVETVWAPTFESFLVCRFPLVYEICVADRAAWQSIIDNDWTDELDRANKWLAQALQQCMLDTPEDRCARSRTSSSTRIRACSVTGGRCTNESSTRSSYELTGEDVRNLRVKFDTASILVAGSTKIEALSQLETLRRKYHKLPERMRTESQGLELAVAHHLEPINSTEAAMIRKKIYKDQALQRPFRWTWKQLVSIVSDAILNSPRDTNAAERRPRGGDPRGVETLAVEAYAEAAEAMAAVRRPRPIARIVDSSAMTRRGTPRASARLSRNVASKGVRVVNRMRRVPRPRECRRARSWATSARTAT